MITKLSSTVLAKIGERLRAAYLVPQAMYTLALAAAEGAALEAYLPAGCLDEIRALCDLVDRSRQDKVVAASEAKQSTGVEQSLVRNLKVWRRQVGSQVETAELAGADLPDDIVQFHHTHAVPVLLDDTSRTLGLLEQNLAALDGVAAGTQALIDEGKQLYQKLLQAERDHEQSRAQDLPNAMMAFCVAKGTLYIGLKMVNAAGHRLHSSDPSASARFNLCIMNHRAAGAAPTPQPSPPSATPAQA